MLVVASPMTADHSSCVEYSRGRDWQSVVTSAQFAGFLRGWCAVPRPLDPDLIVVVLDGPDSMSQRALRYAAIAARWHLVPLIVRLPDPAVLQDLRRSRLTSMLTSRVVSRVIVSVTPPRSVPSSETLIGLGLGDATAPQNGTVPLTIENLDAIAAIHIRAFPDSAMSLLGHRVVERYYRWQFIGPHPMPFARGVWRDGRLVGFVMGGVRSDAVSGFARRFLPIVLLSALTHPRGALELIGPKVVPVLRLMLRRAPSPAGDRQVKSQAQPFPLPAGSPSFGILSIAVDPSAQGSGDAVELMSDAETAACLNGFTRMHLTVDIDNRRAIRFYERLGWDREPLGDRWAGRMVRRLSATG